MIHSEEIELYRRYLAGSKGCLLASRNCGLGDNLFAVAHAWLYCRKSGRDLIIDLCQSRYLSDPEVNAGYLFFEFPDAFQGVRIENPVKISWRLRRLLHMRPAFGWLQVRFPRLAARLEKLCELVGLPIFARSLDLTEQCERDLVRSGQLRSEKFLRFQACHFDHLAEVRAFLLSVQPSLPIRTKLANFLRSSPAKFIGLHVRYYSDQWVAFPRYGDYWLDRSAAIRSICDKVASAREIYGQDCSVLLCTNDSGVESELRRKISGVFIHQKEYGALAEKELFDQGIGDAGVDAVIEMFALKSACCLVRYPPTNSWFSELAAISLSEKTG